MSTPSTCFMYDGISVISVQKPQLCPQWTTIRDMKDRFVLIFFQGVGSLWKGY